jgi:DNA-binding LytR/AlgR family response regulator
MLSPDNFSTRFLLWVAAEEQPVIHAALTGHRITRARTAYDGEFCARHQAFDLILLAITICGKNGWETARRIRRHDVTTPIVVYHTGDLAEIDATELQAFTHVQACVDLMDGATAFQQVFHRIIAAQTVKMLEAAALEASAIAEEISHASADAAKCLNRSRQAVTRSREAAIRSQALKVFLAAGGHQRGFNRLWVRTFEDALRASYDK